MLLRIRIAATLVALARLASFALGQDDDDDVPVPGVTYFVQNTVTGFVINDVNLITVPGFPIVSTPINASDPRGQLWTVELVAEGEDDDDGSVFNFVNTGLNVRIFATGLPGSGITGQQFSSAFQVTPIDDLDGAFTIAFPFINEAITTSSIPGQQLTLQPLNALNPFQQWAFVRFGPLPPDPDDFAPDAVDGTGVPAAVNGTDAAAAAKGTFAPAGGKGATAASNATSAANTQAA